MQKILPNQFLVTLAAIIIILAGIKLSAEIIIPFLLALFIAIICSPIIRYLTSKKIPLGIAIFSLLLIFVIGFFFLASLINVTIKEFSLSIPQYKQILSERLTEIIQFIQHWNFPIMFSKENIMEYFDPSVVMNFFSQLLLSFSGIMSNIFILLLVVIFMLFEAPFAKHKLAIALSGKFTELQSNEEQINKILQGIISYLGVKTLMSLFTAISVWGLLELLNIQYAILWAILSFLLNYIPNIGSFISCTPIIIQSFLLNGFSTGLIVTIGLICINILVGNIIEPKIMGRKLGLSTLVVFLSLLFWGWFLGTVGMLLSVPLTISLKIALESNESTQRYAILLGDIK